MPLFQPIAPPVAMLHSVKDTSDALLANWCISRGAFSRLLDTLEEACFETTHFDRLGVGEEPSTLARKVILTFDDCARHLLDFAVPELVRRNMTAAFYMPTAHIGGYNAWDVKKGGERIELMDKSDLQELIRLGMEIGSHSHRHIELGPLPDTVVREEVSKSKRELEDITGREIISFAYPYGSVPAGYKAILGAAGYRFGVSIYQPAETSLALRRFGVYEKDTKTSLRRKLSQPYRWMRHLYDAVKK